MSYPDPQVIPDTAATYTREVFSLPREDCPVCGTLCDVANHASFVTNIELLRCHEHGMFGRITGSGIWDAIGEFGPGEGFDRQVVCRKCGRSGFSPMTIHAGGRKRVVLDGCICHFEASPS